MVSSPMYDRVMQFAAQADHTEELRSWDDEHGHVLDGFEEAIQRVRHFQQHQGFTGQTGEALKEWADKTVARLESKRRYYAHGITHYVAARQAVAQAKADARQLSPTLLDAKTEALRLSRCLSPPSSPRSPGLSPQRCWQPERPTSTRWKPRRTPSARRRPLRSSIASMRRWASSAGA